MRARATRFRWLAGLVLLPAAGCIASNVVATDQRLVVADVDQLVFQPAAVVALDGLYASVDIRGDAAVSLRRIWYLFEPGGRYTAAALAEVDGVPTFQTLVGTWASSAEGLVLDGGAPVEFAVAGEHVRFSAPTGVVILRREGSR